MLYTNEETPFSSFRDKFTSNLSSATNVKIASGYFGLSELKRHSSTLIAKATAGGEVKLIHGKAGVEGINSNLKSFMLKLNIDLKSANPSSGIFVFKNHYHGKMYITENETTKNLLVGSSNFSASGFEANLEMNYSHTNSSEVGLANAYFDRLLQNSIEIDLFRFPTRSLMQPVETPIVVPHNAIQEIIGRAPDFKIPIRITDRSNLNLFLSSGRLDRVTGIYSPRNFFEVEITIPKALWKPPLTNFIPNSIDPVEFTALTDIGTSFSVNFKRKTSYRGDTRRLHITGGDFMSSPRDELGEYIKGKLMRAGVLAFGEPVTEDTLDEYGSNEICVWMLSPDQLYLKF